MSWLGSDFMNLDTPKTNEACQSIQRSGTDWHYSATLVENHARKMEREANWLRDALDRARNALLTVGALGNLDALNKIHSDPASEAFPKMTLDAALQFADDKATTGGITTCAALETLAKEVRVTRKALAEVVNDLQGLAMAEYGNIGMAADYAPSLPKAVSVLANAAVRDAEDRH